MSMLKAVNPQFFRLGNGREEPDGSYSFLVRFVGREQGITGEMFVRFEERRSEPQPPAVSETEIESEEEEAEDDSDEQAAEPAPAPVENIPAEKVWLFEDLILEEARSREAENGDNRHRFDFPPYERFF